MTLTQPQGLYTELLPGGLDGRYDGEGFVFGAGVSGSYDSNLYLEDDDFAEDDFIGTLSPWVRYSSAPPGGAEWILTGQYSPFFRGYLDHSDLNGVDQSGQLNLTYQGAVARLAARMAYSDITSANRYYDSGRTATERFNFDLGGSYKISDLTSLAAKLNYGTYSTGNSGDTESALAQVTAYWQTTPLIKVGPSFRWARNDSDRYGTTDSAGLLVVADYDITELIHLNGSAGVEQVDDSRTSGDETNFTGGLTASYQAPDLPWSVRADLWYGKVQQFTVNSRYGSGGDSPFSGSLSVRYEPAEQWSVDLMTRYESFPSPSDINYSINDLSFLLLVNRQLSTGSLRMGGSVSFSEYDEVGTVITPREDQDTFGAFLSHRMGIFEERFILDNTLRYSNNSGNRDWSRWQLSTGLNYVF